MHRFFLNIAYCGTNYNGWQVQKNAISVQEILNKHLKTLLKKDIETLGAGRTDTGVHAKQLFVQFDYEVLIDVDKIKYSLNKLLPFDIAVNNLFEVSINAHARFDALTRTYHYFIHKQKDPFLVNKSTLLKHELNIEKMNKAAAILLKHEDFTSFSKLHTDTKTNNCTVTEAYWLIEGSQLKFTITANRFLRNMVRAIVGTLVEIGRGKIDENDFENIILSKNRSSAKESAPACGLYLAKIDYPLSIYK